MTDDKLSKSHMPISTQHPRAPHHCLSLSLSAPKGTTGPMRKLALNQEVKTSDAGRPLILRGQFKASSPQAYGRLLVLEASLGPSQGHPRGTATEPLNGWTKAWRGPQFQL